MQFILTGFTQETAFRVFAFECVNVDRTRTQFTVKADLGLARKYGIRVQELPLLCRAVLENGGNGEGKRDLTFTEDEMQLRARDSALARETAAMKKPRRPASSTNIGSAWRTSQF